MRASTFAVAMLSCELVALSVVPPMPVMLGTFGFRLALPSSTTPWVFDRL